VEKREVRYPSTTQFVIEGTGPKDPAFKPPPEHPPFGEVPPIFTLAQ